MHAAEHLGFSSRRRRRTRRERGREGEALVDRRPNKSKTARPRLAPGQARAGAAAPNPAIEHSPLGGQWRGSGRAGPRGQPGRRARTSSSPFSEGVRGREKRERETGSCGSARRTHTHTQTSWGFVVVSARDASCSRQVGFGMWREPCHSPRRRRRTRSRTGTDAGEFWGRILSCRLALFEK